MSVFFGTDGLRGVAGEELTFDIGFKCGNSLARYVTNGKVLIGRDTRISGAYLASSVACGLMAGGVSVVDVGIIPTAGIAYLTKALGFNYGIAITASHNPREFNGIKIFSQNGEKLTEKDEEKIERGFIKQTHVSAVNIGNYAMDKSLVDKYIDFLINSSNVCFKGLKIGLDCSNGASYKIAPKVFKKLGAKVYKYASKCDGLNINNNCGALHTQCLSKMVVDKKLDIGFAFDGDADRLIAINEKGDIVDGDQIIVALAKSLKKKGLLNKNKVVGTSMTNMGIEIELKQNDIKLIRADVGDKYVASAMFKENLSLGGEKSGHIIISKFLRTGDGILSAIQLLSEVIIENKKVSELCSTKVYPQIIENVLVKDKLRILGNEKVAEAITNAQQELGGHGRVLVRASGTEPIIRVMVECENVSDCKSISQYLVKEIEKINFEVE